MKQLKTFSSIVTKADGNTVQGLWTVFSVIDSYGDRSHKGLAGNATPNSVRFMFNHDLNSVPVAKITKLWEVGAADLPAQVRSLYPEATGGAMVERVYLETPRGQEVKAAVLAGAITDMSYGFDTKRVGTTRDTSGTQIRELYEVDLWEISDVALRGAVPGTLSNVAAKAGYKYAGGLSTRAGARHSAADNDLLKRIHDDVVSLGADCGSGKSRTQTDLWLMKCQLDLLCISAGIPSTRSGPLTMAEIRRKMREMEFGL
ncbi:MAG: HK97 family phage prohead protease [Chloroflexota bacterium]|nr:HK97 family phage prohead protease [Chloroflexota bacterium]